MRSNINDEMNHIVYTMLRIKIAVEEHCVTCGKKEPLYQNFETFLEDVIFASEIGKIDYSREFEYEFPDVAKRINRINYVITNLNYTIRKENTLETLKHMRKNSSHYNYYNVREYMFKKGLAAILVDELMEHLGYQRTKRR